MYVVGYSDTWDEWTITEVPDDSLSYNDWLCGEKPATPEDINKVTCYHYDESWAEYGGTDYRFLTKRGLNLVEAFDIGYWYIKSYINDQDRQEDNNYE